MALAVKAHVVKKGWTLYSPSQGLSEPELFDNKKKLGIEQAEAGKQARGHKSPRLIPEYAGIKKFFLKADGYTSLEGQVLKHDLKTERDVIPAGSRIMRTTAVLEGGLRAVWAGIPWTQEQFLAKAKTLQHPADSAAGLGIDTYQNIFWALTVGPSEVKRFRTSQLEALILRSKQLEEEEQVLHTSLPHDSETILKDKKILLFAELLSNMGHKDVSLPERIINGFQLSGLLEPSGVFEKRQPKNKTPVDKETLLDSTKFSRGSFASSSGSSGDWIMDTELYKTTRDELSKGWLKGPYTPEELDKRFGDRWIAARRFSIKQGDKSRNIDDFSVHGQSSTIVADEYISLGGVDTVVGMAKAMAGSVSADRSIRIPDGSGNFLVGLLHDEWSLEEARSIVGRVVDLKAAYKQVMRSQEDADIAILSVFNPYTQSSELYETLALPFGSSGSVFGFNRVSLALREVFQKHFKMTVTSFFDDFPWLEFELLAENTAAVSTGVFELLGWYLAEEKLKDFSPSFEGLGVNYDFKGLPSGGIMVVGNTEKRRKSNDAEITRILAEQFITQPEASSLRGKLLYGEAQHFGRVLSLTTAALSSRAAGAGSGIVAGELYKALELAKWIMEFSPPRTLSLLSEYEPCTLVFTDAAAEDSQGSSIQRVTVGGVLFSPRLPEPRFFGTAVGEDVVRWWQSEGSGQVIGQGELLPVVMAKWHWREQLSFGRNIFFIDNESAREALIRSFSPVFSSREIILASKISDANSHSLDWYARVPTRSNWADKPSRLDFTHLLSIGARQEHVLSPRVEQLSGIDVTAALSNAIRSRRI